MAGALVGILTGILGVVIGFLRESWGDFAGGMIIGAIGGFVTGLPIFLLTGFS
jgi:hypothetical protein